MIHVGKLMEVLRDMSDIELQRHEWIESQSNTVYFPSEMISQLFDDTGLSDHLRSDRCPEEFGENVFMKLKELHQSTSRIDDSMPPERLLHSPEMELVRRQAANILDLLAKERLR